MPPTNTYRPRFAQHTCGTELRRVANSRVDEVGSRQQQAAGSSRRRSSCTRTFLFLVPFATRPSRLAVSPCCHLRYSASVSQENLLARRCIHAPVHMPAQARSPSRRSPVPSPVARRSPAPSAVARRNEAPSPSTRPSPAPLLSAGRNSAVAPRSASRNRPLPQRTPERRERGGVRPLVGSSSATIRLPAEPALPSSRLTTPSGQYRPSSRSRNQPSLSPAAAAVQGGSTRGRVSSATRRREQVSSASRRTAAAIDAHRPSASRPPAVSVSGVPVGSTGVESGRLRMGGASRTRRSGVGTQAARAKVRSTRTRL